MPTISPDYASPGLRMGLLLEDFPQASHRFEVRDAAALGIPEHMAGTGEFCVAIIERPGMPDAIGWKPLPAKGDPEAWNVLCTKALGRALKRAGYPDDLPDLKALVLWRQRNAEIGAIGAGHIQQALPPSAQAIESGQAKDPVAKALESAATSRPRQDDDGDVAQGEVVDPEEMDNLRAEVAELVAGLDGRDAANYKSYLQGIDAPDDPEKMSRAQLQDALGWLDPDAG